MGEEQETVGGRKKSRRGRKGGCDSCSETTGGKKGRVVTQKGDQKNQYYK